MPLLYLQITPQTITVRAVHREVSMTELACIAIALRGAHRVVAGVGSAAVLLQGQPQVQLHHPFLHPRTLVPDYDTAVALLQQLIRQALGSRWMAVRRPIIVMHPMGQPEGGFTAVELRALASMACEAGARKVHLWTGQALNDAQVQALVGVG